MKYTDENLMSAIEELFQKIRQQSFGGGDRRTAYMERMGTPEGHGLPDSGMKPSYVMKRIGTPEGRVGVPIEQGNARRPLLARERILRLIGEDEPISQIKLATYLSVRPQSISETLAKLEKDGYISRTKNEKDKREILVSLTENGKQRSREVQSAREKQLSDFLSPLMLEERKQLFQLISKLIDTDEIL